MNWIVPLLVVTAVIFFVYAMVTQFNQTDKTQPFLKRVRAALYAGAMAVGGAITAYVMQWANQ